MVATTKKKYTNYYTNYLNILLFGVCFYQKFNGELQGHQPVIDKVLSTSDKLISEKHFASKSIKDKGQQLQVAWDDLSDKSKRRKKQLDMSLQAQKVNYFSWSVYFAM